jgi:hypothetical protein
VSAIACFRAAAVQTVRPKQSLRDARADLTRNKHQWRRSAIPPGFLSGGGGLHTLGGLLDNDSLGLRQVDGTAALDLNDRRTCPLAHGALDVRSLSSRFRGIPEANVTGFCYRSAVLEGATDRKLLILIWLPPRDSNPDMLIQSQLSCR